MAKLKENIWYIFYVLLIVGVIGLSVLSYNNYAGLIKYYSNQNEQKVEFIYNSLHTIFASHENMLNLVGRELIKDVNFNSLGTTDLFEEYLRLNTSVIAMGLLTPEGRFVYISNNIDIATLPNLKEQPESRDTFLYTLETDKMVLGRTYFFKPLNDIVIPIRKAVRDRSGKPVAVITGAFTMKESEKFFSKKIFNTSGQSVQIYRTFDSYDQYSTNQNAETYEKKYPKEKVEQIYRLYREKYNVSRSQMLNEDKVYTIMRESVNDGKNILSSIKYDNRYEFWIISNIQQSTILKIWAKNIRIMLIIAVFGYFILFWMFRRVAAADAKTKASLKEQADRDTLTGLYNRNYLRYNLEGWMSDNKNDFFLLYIDLDKFKDVNDSYGHLFGDNVLVEVSRRIKKHISSTSMLVRHGGDEFLLFMRLRDGKELKEESRKLLDYITEPYSIDGKTFLLGASIGVAIYPEHGNSLDELIRAADMAMYKAKEQRNTIRIYSQGMEKEKLRKIQIEQELKNALKKNELFMVYQPQFNVDGEICGFEALIRWNNEKLGFVSPGEFIPIAEDSGLMPELGEFVINVCIKDFPDICSAIRKETDIDVSISINISIKQFLEPGFLEDFLERAACKKCSNKIVVEITEGLFIEDIEYILPQLKMLKEAGIKISMDDFGTGYSSLGMLKKLPIDELKIDKSFVDDIENNEIAGNMVKNVISIGCNMGMVVLAEGVENEEQYNILRKYNCDRFQGYYFAKPMEKNSLLEFIGRNFSA